MKLTYTPKVYECSCCGEAKPETEYYRQSYTDKRSNECKTCTNVKRSVQRHKAKHGKFVSKEKIRGMVATIDYTLADWKDAMLHFGGECPICGVKEGRARKSKFDRDHIVAISRGGETVRNNVMPCCPKCNRSRGNSEMFEWFRKRPTWTQEREDKIRQWVEQKI